MEPPAFPVSSTKQIIGEDKANIKENLHPKSVSSQCMAKRTISVACSLLALFFRLLPLFSMSCSSLGKRGVDILSRNSD